MAGVSGVGLSKPKIGRIIVSLTTIPRRFETSLPDVLDSIARQDRRLDVVLNIPAAYKKWGAATPPEALRRRPGVTIHQPTRDYGPATKLLGGLEFARDRDDITHIMTVDDDIVLTDPHYFSYLINFSRLLPDHAITVGGMKLLHPPYTRRNGLRYHNRFAYVDMTAGYRGVVYPVYRMRGSNAPFSLMTSLPPGIFNDDDVYAAAVLSTMDIPLFAVPRKLGPKFKSAKNSGDSAVSEQTLVPRVANEMELCQAAVQGGLLDLEKRARRKLPLGKLARLAAAYGLGLVGW